MKRHFPIFYSCFFLFWGKILQYRELYHHGVYYVTYMSCWNISSITITTNKSFRFSYFFYQDFGTYYTKDKSSLIITIFLFWIIPKCHFCKLNNFPQNLNLIIISLLLRFQSWSSEFPQPYLYFNIYSCTLVQ